MNGTVWHNIEKFRNIIGGLWKYSIKFVGNSKHLDGYALKTFNQPTVAVSTVFENIWQNFATLWEIFSIKTGVLNSLFFDKNRKKNSKNSP